MREIIRAAIIAALIFMIAQDIKEVITAMSAASSFRPVIDWMYSVPSESALQKRSPAVEGEDQDANSDEKKDDEEKSGNPLQDPALESIRNKLKSVGYSFATGDIQDVKTLTFDDEEKQQIMVLRAHLTSVMQEWCLPKLVCELHASVAERSAVSDAERSLLSLIRETSLGTMGEVISRYHFAAHMGQLLSGVEGNGCHNLYPNCPLSGNRVLQMVKKVRLR